MAKNQRKVTLSLTKSKDKVTMPLDKAQKVLFSSNNTGVNRFQLDDDNFEIINNELRPRAAKKDSRGREE